ncbi:EAL domain-containing protein [Chitinilyticum litopenaei]|uniref:EAL domain-containing protein n=1 Tax=Chitinilyticum litopenaei TaxID=1121276 RepID=UPI0004290571|nr:EAL domain-containing protein [Chitinilyticum litopenaei]
MNPRTLLRLDAQTRFEQPFHALGCDNCRNLTALGFEFTMAFQPIMNLDTGRPYAYEALIRGANGEPAGEVLAKVNDGNRYRFDQACRVKAIELAAGLGLPQLPDCRLSINFLPNAVYRPETCIRATLEAAERHRFPTDRLMFEVTEGEQVRDSQHLIGIFEAYRRHGFITAIDDFGAGYSGLNLLATFQPDVLKIDMELTRGIDQSPSRQAILAGVLLTCERLDITVIAEGVETQGELATLSSMGVRLIQGYLFARPEIEALPLARP